MLDEIFLLNGEDVSLMSMLVTAIVLKQVPYSTRCLFIILINLSGSACGPGLGRR